MAGFPSVGKYRKKPVVIEAIQFTGGNFDEIKELTKTSPTNREVLYIPHSEKLIIKTLEGDMTANKWDYIIKGIQGEFYPCKPDIFEQTYEKVCESK